MIDTNLIFFLTYIVVASIGLLLVMLFLSYFICIYLESQAPNLNRVVECFIWLCIFAVWITISQIVIEFIIWKYSDGITILGMVKG